MELKILLKVILIILYFIDLFNPFVIFIGFGFFLGALSSYLLMKISYLEKENEKLISKISEENKKPIVEKLKKNDFLQDKKEENKDEKKEEIKEEKIEENKEEKKEEIKEEKIEEKKDENNILKNSNFKRPEIKQKNYVEEGEWKVVRKGQKRKKP